MKTILVLLCLLVAGTAWMVMNQAKIIWKDVVRDALSKSCEIIRDEYPCERLKPKSKPKPKFFKVLDPDILIRANEIEAWRIYESYDKKDIPLEKCQGGRLYKQWTACSSGDFVCAEKKWIVRAKWEGGWYDIKEFKTRQKARDWLDRNIP